jgi:predicted permease
MQPMAYLFIIVLAHLLKRIGMFGKNDFKVLAKITLNITLPGAIIASFDSFSMDYSLLVLIGYGLLANVLLIVAGYWSMRKRSNDKKAYAVLNASTYNIGNFSFPFIQGLFGPPGLVIAALFDLGNAVMATGITYSIASAVAGGERPKAKRLAAKLFSSVPFDTYLVMLGLSFLGLHLPPVVSLTAQMIGKANPIVAMLMIGLMLEINFGKEWIQDSAKILAIRLLGAIAFSAAVWYFAPLERMVKLTMILLFFSPISSIAAPFTEQCTEEGRLASFTSSLSVIVGIALYIVLIPFLVA